MLHYSNNKQSDLLSSDYHGLKVLIISLPFRYRSRKYVSTTSLSIYDMLVVKGINGVYDQNNVGSSHIAVNQTNESFFKYS